ncbi:hypothetical protein BH24ACT5_BH24ACT5_30630 [soil metagenome]
MTGVSAQVLGLGLTARQIDHWRREGVFGVERQNLGSGSRCAWSERDRRRLAGLGLLADDLAVLGLRMSFSLVGRVWQEWDDGDLIVIDEGAIHIEMSLPWLEPLP